MRLLHFVSLIEEKEYIVFVDNDDKAEDSRLGGYKLKGEVEFDEGKLLLPLDTNLWPQK